MNHIQMQSIPIERWDALLQEAPPAGCDAVEVYAYEDESFSVGLLDGEIDTYETNRSSGIGLRTDCGQIGAASSQAPDQEPQALLQNAVESAAIVESEDAPYQRFFAGSPQYAPLPAIDPRLPAMDAAQKIALCRQLESLALQADPHITRLEDCQLASSIYRSTLRNSLGLRVASERGYAIAYVSPIAEKDGEIKNGLAYDIARCVEELDLAKIAREAAEDVMAQLGASSLPSGSYGVVFKNRAMISLLSTFCSIFSADAAQKGMSLLAGKEGTRIASSAVQLLDLPMHPMSLLPSNYDGEGVATCRTAIIQDGDLQTLLHNRKTAAKAGTQTTANASRTGLGGIMGVSPNNLVLQEGTQSCEQLFAHMHNGVYITHVSGLHAGANPVSGAFSLLSRGFVVQNGQLAQPIDQITISGNFYELLQGIQALGDDLDFATGSIGSPSVWVEQLTVAGK